MFLISYENATRYAPSWPHRCVKLDHIFLLSEKVLRRLNQRNGFSELQPFLSPAVQAQAGERIIATKRQCSARSGKRSRSCSPALRRAWAVELTTKKADSPRNSRDFSKAVGKGMVSSRAHLTSLPKLYQVVKTLLHRVGGVHSTHTGSMRVWLPLIPPVLAIRHAQY